MKRKSPAARLDLMVQAAITVFIRVGYRRAQMADIAREMGVAPGTLYLYVESKEALFDLALRHASGNELPVNADCLPLPTPSPAEILARVRTEFSGFALTSSIDIKAGDRLRRRDMHRTGRGHHRSLCQDLSPSPGAEHDRAIRAGLA